MFARAVLRVLVASGRVEETATSQASCDEILESFEEVCSSKVGAELRQLALQTLTCGCTHKLPEMKGKGRKKAVFASADVNACS